jgi:hypothetical protein
MAEALTFDAANARFTRILLGGGPFYEKLAAVLYEDETFRYLQNCVTMGWPRKPPCEQPEVRPYWPIRHRLQVSGPYLILEDDRVCVYPSR